MSTRGNRNRRIIGTISIMLLLLVFSCDTSRNKERANDESKSVRLKYETTQYEKKQTGCTGIECASFSVAYPIFDQADEWNATVNDLVDDKIRAIAADFIMKGSPKESIEALAEGFVASYQEFQLDFPESSTGWYFKLKASTLYIGDEFICIQFDSESYTGGAHPLSNRQFMMVNMEGAVLDTYEDFIVSMPILRNLGEQLFRQSQNMKQEQTYSEAGYLFTNDVFALPEQFGFNTTGMLLYYNPYEIADYSKGSIEFTLSYSQLEETYKFSELE